MLVLLALLTLVVATRVVGSVSTTTIAERLWLLWTTVSPSESVKLLNQKRRRLVEVRTARANTSSKDEFAKWARLDREHQALKTEIERLNPVVAKSRLGLQAGVRVARWTLTTGITMWVQWRFRRVPVFWLPRGALPGVVEWFLALPSAPRGSISVATWIVVSGTALDALRTALGALARRERAA